MKGQANIYKDGLDEYFQHEAINRGQTVRHTREQLFFLANGDAINPRQISAVRVSERASRSTGQIGAFVHVRSDDSWYSCYFSDVETARKYVDLLFDLVNWLLNSSERSRMAAAGRAASTAEVEEILGSASKHAAPGDADQEGDRDDV